MPIRYKSSATFLETPVLRSQWGQIRRTTNSAGRRGVIALGDVATGVVALGGVARGLVAV
jgi:hypothetical protein